MKALRSRYQNARQSSRPNEIFGLIMGVLSPTACNSDLENIDPGDEEEEEEAEEEEGEGRCFLLEEAGRYSTPLRPRANICHVIAARSEDQ
uniref:Uncharacterized protein n=1 Tax=Vespula pensylvanica TaxID=30213 RepID=A0A834UD37_VESPE|nr:hypothetical protein H0235_004642 [Vespula pensylvanica]